MFSVRWIPSILYQACFHSTAKKALQCQREMVLDIVVYLLPLLCYQFTTKLFLHWVWRNLYN